MFKKIILVALLPFALANVAAFGSENVGGMVEVKTSVNKKLFLGGSRETLFSFQRHIINALRLIGMQLGHTKNQGNAAQEVQLIGVVPEIIGSLLGKIGKDLKKGAIRNNYRVKITDLWGRKDETILVFEFKVSRKGGNAVGSLRLDYDKSLNETNKFWNPALWL